ncbi:MAG TPA: hypothetical protein VFD49_10315 [Candidatus Dormibacteraeota bacterium]|nr:hypothetical protein [Candidatus Dormibacteraeota bacterium]
MAVAGDEGVGTAHQRKLDEVIILGIGGQPGRLGLVLNEAATAAEMSDEGLDLLGGDPAPEARPSKHPAEFTQESVRDDQVEPPAMSGVQDLGGRAVR